MHSSNKQAIKTVDTGVTSQLFCDPRSALKTLGLASTKALLAHLEVGSCQ